MSCSGNDVKYSYIQIYDPPKEIIEWYHNQKYSLNEYSISKLRDDVISLSDQELFHAKSILQEERMHARLKNLLREEDKINQIINTNELIDKLEKTEYAEIKIVVINRLIEIDNNSYMYFIQLLMKPYTDNIFDLVFKALLKTMKIKDIFEDLLSLLVTNCISDPDDFSSLVQLMGYSKNEKVLKYL